MRIRHDPQSLAGFEEKFSMHVMLSFRAIQMFNVQRHFERLGQKSLVFDSDESRVIGRNLIQPLGNLPNIRSVQNIDICFTHEKRGGYKS